MKIYTKTGDDGTTSLFGGKRVSKNDIRVDAYGTIDELNSFIGWLIESISISEVKEFNQTIQHILFNIGSIVATEDERMISKLPAIRIEDIEKIEKAIDTMYSELPAMTNFILPSGHIEVAIAHICRTVCRRAERRLVGLSQLVSHEELTKSIQFLNRLSDYYFVLSRKLTKYNKANEVIWNKEAKL